MHEGTVVVMAARMHPAKDWRLFFEAARALAREEPGWRFVAVGDGPERATLLAEAADLVDAGVMEFPEGGLEVLPLIAAADIGVLVTDPRYHAEGCSNSIMEYMACGLPVVCTDSGGNPELVPTGSPACSCRLSDVGGARLGAPHSARGPGPCPPNGPRGRAATHEVLHGGRHGCRVRIGLESLLGGRRESGHNQSQPRPADLPGNINTKGGGFMRVEEDLGLYWKTMMSGGAWPNEGNLRFFMDTLFGDTDFNEGGYSISAEAAA